MNTALPLKLETVIKNTGLHFLSLLLNNPALAATSEQLASYRGVWEAGQTPRPMLLQRVEVDGEMINHHILAGPARASHNGMRVKPELMHLSPFVATLSLTLLSFVGAVSAGDSRPIDVTIGAYQVGLFKDDGGVKPTETVFRTFHLIPTIRKS